MRSQKQWSWDIFKRKIFRSSRTSNHTSDHRRPQSSSELLGAQSFIAIDARRRLAPQIPFSVQVAVGSTLLFLVTILVIGTLSFRSFKTDLNEILLGQQRILLDRI